jgi:hypothetical protein
MAMVVLIALVYIAGIAAVGAGGAVLAVTATEYSGCVDECHGAAFWGAGGLAFIVLGLLLVLVGATVVSQRDAARREDIDRELRLRFGRD